MKLQQLKELVNAYIIYENNEEHLIEHVFASDLMSDCLAMINDGDETLLITGLANLQSLRTAEMLDITTILFVRNKIPDEEMIRLAKELEISLYSTAYTMYETCGKLYSEGLRV